MPPDVPTCLSSTLTATTTPLPHSLEPTPNRSCTPVAKRSTRCLGSPRPSTFPTTVARTSTGTFLPVAGHNNVEYGSVPSWMALMWPCTTSRVWPSTSPSGEHTQLFTFLLHSCNTCPKCRAFQKRLQWPERQHVYITLPGTESAASCMSFAEDGDGQALRLWIAIDAMLALSSPWSNSKDNVARFLACRTAVCTGCMEVSEQM